MKINNKFRKLYQPPSVGVEWSVGIYGFLSERRESVEITFWGADGTMRAEMTPDDARALAKMLVEYANKADKYTGTQS